MSSVTIEFLDEENGKEGLNDSEGGLIDSEKN